MLAGPSPEVLIGPIAAATAAIRVGSGGVMLPHYSPLKVAESFSVLAGLFPRPDRPRDRSRGRHRSADHVRAPARPPPGGARRLPRAARRAARLPRGPAAARSSVRALARHAARAPARPGAVAARLLAAERAVGGGARPAVRLCGLHQPRRRADRRELPRAVRRLGAPGGAAVRGRGVGALRGESRGGRAPRGEPPLGVRQAAPRRADRGAAARGGGAALDEARRAGRLDGRRRRRAVLGTGEQVRAELEQVAAEYGASEVIVVTIIHDHALRRRSYELLAEAFELAPRDVTRDGARGVSVEELARARGPRTRRCRRCDVEINAASARCPYCGAARSSSASRSSAGAARSSASSLVAAAADRDARRSWRRARSRARALHVLPQRRPRGARAVAAITTSTSRLRTGPRSPAGPTPRTRPTARSCGRRSRRAARREARVAAQASALRNVPRRGGRLPRDDRLPGRSRRPGRSSGRATATPTRCSRSTPAGARSR